MLTFLSIIHICIGFGLVCFVLLQDPKGGAAGVFGGGSSSNSFFGASGATNFLSTLTKWLAVCFAISCLLLTAMTAKKPTSVLDADPNLAAPAAAVPVAPEGAVPVAPTTPAPGDASAGAPGANTAAPVKAAPAVPVSPTHK